MMMTLSISGATVSPSQRSNRSEAIKVYSEDRATGMEILL